MPGWIHSEWLVMSVTQVTRGRALARWALYRAATPEHTGWVDTTRSAPVAASSSVSRRVNWLARGTSPSAFRVRRWNRL